MFECFSALSSIPTPQHRAICQPFPCPAPMGRLRNGANTVWEPSSCSSSAKALSLHTHSCSSSCWVTLLPPPGPEFLLLTQPCMHWPQSSLWKDAHADTNTGQFQGYGPSGGLVAQEHHELAVLLSPDLGGSNAHWEETPQTLSASTHLVPPAHNSTPGSAFLQAMLLLAGAPDSQSADKGCPIR